MAEGKIGSWPLFCLYWFERSRKRMPRRREVPKREILPDPKYNSRLVAKFVNNIMRRGKKSLAERVLYGSFDLMQIERAHV